MKTIIHKYWDADLYLDAFGSVPIIVASALIVLFVAASAIAGSLQEQEEVVHACAPWRFATVDFSDQRPGAARAAKRTDCV